IERAIFWVRLSAGRSRALVERFLELADGNEFDEAARAAHGSADPVVRVLHCGLVHRNYDVTSALEMAATAELRRAERFLAILDTIITLAPLLGILGTVVGIIQSFDMLSLSATVEDPQAVTGGIAQAMITTATGLTIAIAALIPHNWFRALADGLRHEMEEAATRLEIVFRKRADAEGKAAEDPAGTPDAGERPPPLRGEVISA
ncbi:MAG: MotA/TolQ/ExbB proton channel family protein, partial [Planctomycetota bacterium]